MTYKLWEEKNIFWPECEQQKDYEHAFGRIDAIDAAVRLCKGRTRCIQAGGWIGMWPLKLSEHFEHVATWEPVPYLYECLLANLCHRKVTNVTARPVALGAHDGAVELTVALSGCTSAVPEDSAKYQSRVLEKRAVPMEKLDGALAGAAACDALFLDVERYEISVLEGAKQLIKKFSPVITVEILKGENERMGAYMESIGYRPRDRAHNDWIFTR